MMRTLNELIRMYRTIYSDDYRRENQTKSSNRYGVDTMNNEEAIKILDDIRRVKSQFGRENNQTTQDQIIALSLAITALKTK